KAEINNHRVCSLAAAQPQQAIILTDRRNMRNKFPQSPVSSIQIRRRRTAQDGERKSVQYAERLFLGSLTFSLSSQPGSGELCGQPLELDGRIIFDLCAEADSQRDQH